MMFSTLLTVVKQKTQTNALREMQQQQKTQISAPREMQQQVTIKWIMFVVNLNIRIIIDYDRSEVG